MDQTMDQTGNSCSGEGEEGRVAKWQVAPLSRFATGIGFQNAHSPKQSVITRILNYIGRISGRR